MCVCVCVYLCVYVYEDTHIQIPSQLWFCGYVYGYICVCVDFDEIKQLPPILLCIIYAQHLILHMLQLTTIKQICFKEVQNITRVRLSYLYDNDRDC